MHFDHAIYPRAVLEELAAEFRRALELQVSVQSDEAAGSSLVTAECEGAEEVLGEFANRALAASLEARRGG